MPFDILADGSFPEIGPRYDVGVSTRNGDTLNCKNKDGTPVPISRMAYMMSVDRRPSQYESSGRVKTMREATELQEKSQLVQLGTSTSIDREFDQWVQNTQGDWSGGIGQRVYGLGGVADQYFDGEGLLWPINDWIPQVALRGPTQGLPSGVAGAPGPDSGTETIAPGGAATTKSMSCVFASFQATGVVALVGVKGAFTAGSNTAVAPPFGQATSLGSFLVAKVGGQRSSASAPNTMGETSAATSSFDFSGINTDNVIGTANTFVVPAGGITVSSISIYMGGNTAAVNTRFCIWNATTHALIADSALFSAAKTRALRTKAITPVFIAAGTTIRIGFWRQQSQDAQWGVAASGTFNLHANTGSIDEPRTACSGAYVCGHIQAYITYTTGTTSDITQSNPGPAPGWSKIAQQNSPDATQQVQIWAKPNCAASETAPAFAATAGASPMHAQLSEWVNIALASPTDQFATATSSLLNAVTATNPASDTAAGDLVIMAVRSQLSAAATAGFVEVFNNGMTATQLGISGATSLVNHDSFSYGIVPPAGSAAFNTWAVNGTAGGYVEGLGMGYAVCYLDSQGTPHWHATFFSGDNAYDVDLGANTGSKQGPLHMHIAAGYLWVLFSEYPNANNLSVRMLGCAYGSNTFVQLRSDNLTPTTAGTDGFSGLIAASFVGGKLYVAVLQADQNAPPGVPTVNRNGLYVLDYSAGSGIVPSGAAAPAIVFPFERGFKAVDINWQGNTLLLAVGDGLNAYIYATNSPFSVLNTQAVIPGIANALLCSVGSTVFVAGWTSGLGGINRMDLYTLNGGTLTEIPFTPIVPFLDSVTSPQAYGGYAIWAVSYATPGAVDPTQKTVTVYAYDVVRDRLFRALTFTDPSWTGSDIFGHDVIGLYGVAPRTQAAGATFQSQMGLAIFSGQLSNALESAREFYWGVIPITPAPPFAGLLQMGVNIISGLFDFTAATNKLFRATLSHFIAGLVAGQDSPNVTLNVWFDQDPNRLSAVPDFTIGTGTAPTPLPSQLDLNLFTNQVARKMVYQVISDGGGFNGSQGWQNSPKITDVIIQAATGWVWDLAFDLSPYSVVNGGGQQEYAYSDQSPTDTTSLSYDHVVAYNFLKKLWREKGGECTLYLPNGDSYPALIQLLQFESPKPIAGIGRSDVQPTWQVFVICKFREDI